MHITLTRIHAVLLFAGLLWWRPGFAQQFIRNPPGLDTLRRTSAACDTLSSTQHWLVGAKYPVASEVLAVRANAWLQSKGAVDTAVTGLIGFRFLVDCEGQPSNFLCEQSTLHWKPARFPEALVTSLYRFVLSLAPMPVGRFKYPGPQQGAIQNYYTYFSFLLKNGKVQSVAP